MKEELGGLGVRLFVMLDGHGEVSPQNWKKKSTGHLEVCHNALVKTRVHREALELSISIQSTFFQDTCYSATIGVARVLDHTAPDTY